MSNKVLTILVLISLGLGGFATWKHLYKDAEEIAHLTMEGMQKIQAKKEQEEQSKQLEKIRAKAAEINADKDSPFAGNPEGDLTIVYFFDYRCGYSRKSDPVVDELVASDPKLRVIYKEYPIFQDSTIATAALAAHKQGRYLDMHRALMAHQRNLSEEVVAGVAKDLNLDMDAFEKDKKDPSIKAMLEKNHKLAESLGVNAVPMFIVGGSMVLPGAVGIDEFQAAVQKVREELAGGTTQKEESPHDNQPEEKQAEKV
jgi:protein-disulfide isomerase